MKRIIALLSLSVCHPAAMSSTSATEGPASTGSSGDPSTGGTTSEPTTGTTVAPVPDLPLPCPVGSLGCPCAGGGACDGGLVCEAGACAEGCQVGSAGCPCTQGGGCDAGLMCVDGECAEAVSPPCTPEDQITDDCCGDMVIDAFEECDAGYANADDHDCTASCKVAVCGDGLTHEPVEACDGEDHCTAECTFKTCGDGIRDPWEWCDPVRPNDPECTDLCTDARKFLFITSTQYKGGELGGLAGADAKCQARADAVELPGTYRALLGTGPDDAPMTTWKWSHAPYVNVKGEPILGFTPPWSGLCGSDSILSENGFPHSGCEVPYLDKWSWLWYVHEFYNADEPTTCNGWTNVDAFGGALAYQCSYGVPGASCSLAAPIVCVEQ